MLKFLKKAAHEASKTVRDGGTFVQERQRQSRALARKGDFDATIQWVTEKSTYDPFTSPDLATLLANPRSKFRAGHKIKLIRESSDIDRKLQHGGGQKSYLVAFPRADDTIFVIWWVMRDETGNYSGLKPYYLLDATESPADYLYGPHYVHG